MISFRKIHFTTDFYLTITILFTFIIIKANTGETFMNKWINWSINFKHLLKQYCLSSLTSFNIFYYFFNQYCLASFQSMNNASHPFNQSILLRIPSINTFYIASLQSINTASHLFNQSILPCNPSVIKSVF